MERELGEGIGISTGPNYVSGNQLTGNNLIISNAGGRADTGTSYVSLDTSGGNNSTGPNYVSGDQLAGNNLIISNAVGRTYGDKLRFFGRFRGKDKYGDKLCFYGPFGE